MEENLCLSCGLCCNGVIFGDVQLQPEDDAVRLQSLGFPLTKSGNRGSPKFLQPCVAHDGCQCRIYAERPKYCCDFDCLLLKNVQASRLGIQAARRIITDARKRADQVRSLLRQLGDTDETLPLASRFRRCTQRLERSGFDEVTADPYAELTVAIHRLNRIIAEAFYPGCGAGGERV